MFSMICWKFPSSVDDAWNFVYAVGIMVYDFDDCPDVIINEMQDALQDLASLYIYLAISAR